MSETGFKHGHDRTVFTATPLPVPTFTVFSTRPNLVFRAVVSVSTSAGC